MCKAKTQYDWLDNRDCVLYTLIISYHSNALVNVTPSPHPEERWGINTDDLVKRKNAPANGERWLVKTPIQALLKPHSLSTTVKEQSQNLLNPHPWGLLNRQIPTYAPSMPHISWGGEGVGGGSLQYTD